MQSYTPPTAPQGRQDAFNMNSMGHALPDVSYPGYGSPSFSSGVSPSHQYQMHNQQFSGQTNMNQQVQKMPYNMQYQPQYQGMYNQGQNQGVPSIGPGPGPGMGGNQYYQPNTFMGQSQQAPSPFFIQPSQYRGQNQAYTASQFLGPVSPRGTFPSDIRLGNEYLATAPVHGGSVRSSSIGELRQTGALRNSADITSSIQQWPVFRRARSTSKTSPKW
jgi:hypothetical protein